METSGKAAVPALGSLDSGTNSSDGLALVRVFENFTKLSVNATVNVSAYEELAGGGDNATLLALSEAELLFSFRLNLGLNCLLGALSLLGLVFCAPVLLVICRCSETEITARWSIGHVIGLDLATCVRRLFDVVCNLLVLLYPAAHAFDCHLHSANVLFTMWTTSPSIMAVLCLACEQLLSFLFPLAMRLQSRTLLKKAVFSLLIWLPSLAKSASTLARWAQADAFPSCTPLLRALFATRAWTAAQTLTTVLLNAAAYAVLLARVHFYFLRSRLGSHALQESAQRDRRLACTFLWVFLSSVGYMMPPFLFALLASGRCGADLGCLRRQEDLMFGLTVLYQINCIFDPVFIAVRMPVVGSGVRGLLGGGAREASHAPSKPTSASRKARQAP